VQAAARTVAVLVRRRLSLAKCVWQTSLSAVTRRKPGSVGCVAVVPRVMARIFLVEDCASAMPGTQEELGAPSAADAAQTATSAPVAATDALSQLGCESCLSCRCPSLVPVSCITDSGSGLDMLPSEVPAVVRSVRPSRRRRVAHNAPAASTDCGPASALRHAPRALRTCSR
jgi:hypothetical protein